MSRRKLLPWVALALGCIHRAPMVHFDERTPVSVAILIDDKDGTHLDQTPPEVRAAIERELAHRNAAVQLLAGEALLPLTRNRSSKTRAEMLAEALGPQRLFLLVELKVQFFGQFEGGYKWDVSGQLTVAQTDRLVEASSAPMSTAAFLAQDFEREPEALQQTAAVIGERSGRLFDDHFAGRPGTLEVTPTTPAMPGPSGRWERKPIYFVLLDRFAPSEAHPQLPTDRADPDFWHGGDLSTLRLHLDDLQKLGVGTLWLSPLSRCSERKKGPFGPSHCYWVEDLAEFERRFGTREELRTLREELHARGMRLVLDVVLNHVAPDSPLLKAHPDWFHPPKALINYEDPVQLEQGQLGGMPDLAQEKPEVASYLIQTTRDWVRTVEPDGIRLDAVKHVPVAFWSKLSGTLHREFPGLALIGEDLEFDSARLSARGVASGFDAVFDFPLQAALLGAFCKAEPVGLIAARLGLDRLAPGLQWVTLLDNHDLPRLASSCSGDQASAALGVLFALRGVPSLTYGTEAGLEGAADPLNRGDLEFPVSSPLRGTIAELAALRQAHPALSEGRTWVLAAEREQVGVLRAANSELAWLSVSRGPAVPHPAFGSGWRQVWHHQGSGTTVVVSVAAPTATSTATLAKLEAAPERLLRFSAQSSPSLAPGDRLAVVGAAPELGGWNPSRAVLLDQAVWLPARALYELKLIVRHADGGIAWQPGGNQLLYVPAEGPDRIALEWEPPRSSGKAFRSIRSGALLTSEDRTGNLGGSRTRGNM